VPLRKRDKPDLWLSVSGLTSRPAARMTAVPECSAAAVKFRCWFFLFSRVRLEAELSVR
jgi:hypothetical protein